MTIVRCVAVVRRGLVAPLSWPPHRWRRVSTVLGVGVLAVFVLAVSGSTADAQRAVLDDAQAAYRASARAWLGPVSAIARRLFVSLAALEVTVSGILWALRRDSLDEIAAKFLLKFIVLSVVLMLITSAGYWLPPIVEGLARAGELGSGRRLSLGPSGIVDLGVEIALWKIDTRGLPLTFASLETALYALISRIVILASFVAVAGLVVLAWVEAYVALAGGVLFLGLGGFRATAQYAENYLNYLVFVGTRLFLLYLLLGVGTSLIESTISGMAPTQRPEEMAELLAISVIFALLVLRVPGSMAGRVASGGNFGLANALRT